MCQSSGRPHPHSTKGNCQRKPMCFTLSQVILRRAKQKTWVQEGAASEIAWDMLPEYKFVISHALVF